MNKLSLSTRMILVLTLITVMSGGILAGWDMYTKPKVAYHREQALKKAIGEVLPAHDLYETRETDAGTIYIGTKNDSEQPVGIAFMAVGSGFQGELRIMVGLTPDLNQLTGIKVLEQIETPGLGTKIVVDPSNKQNVYWFPDQFKGIHVDPEIVVVKNAKPSTNFEVQGITGATISSIAVTDILNKRIIEMKAILTSKGGSES
ncbi:MAG: FMN-binding protein [Candidatus Marinimicrobia bacterium]|nr:FMN-binding protein [Candidatus Neomarinimicrobiota bacterium]